MGLHPDLRRWSLFLLVLGPIFALVGVVALVLFFRGLQDEKDALGKGLVLLYGVVMLFLAWLMLVNAPRWYRRATWVLNNTQPQTSILCLREESSSDSTNLYADLYTIGDISGTEPLEIHWVHRPRWDLEGMLEQSESMVKVYRDPSPGGPVVIETSKGLLWPYPTKTFGRRVE